MVTKPFECVVCGEDNPKKFYETQDRKSLCKKHFFLKASPERRKKILKPYNCKFCQDPDESHYHVYCKSKCKKHFNTKVINTSV